MHQERELQERYQDTKTVRSNYMLARSQSARPCPRALFACMLAWGGLRPDEAMHPLALNQKTAKLRNAVFFAEAPSGFCIAFYFDIHGTAKKQSISQALGSPPSRSPLLLCSVRGPRPSPLGAYLVAPKQSKR